MKTCPSLRCGLSALGAALLLACTGGESPDKLMASARSHLEKRQTNAAVIQLKRALELAPESAEARFLLGKTLLASGDPAGGEAELRKAWERGTPNSTVLPELARAMLQLGQAPKILEQFGSLELQDTAAQADLKTTVAAAHAQTGNRSKAQEQLAQALQLLPSHAPAVMVKARMLADAGDVDGALAVLDAVLAQDPTNEHAGVAKGYLLWFGKRDADAALEAHRKVLSGHPGAVAARAEIVTLLFGQGKFEAARAEFEGLRKTAPAHPQTLFFEAQFAYVDGQLQRAREVADEILKAVPDHLRALELAAAAEYRMGNDLQAQELAARALKVSPGLVLSRHILARSHLRTGRPGLALEAVKPLIEAADPDPEGLALAGTAYAQLGDLKSADAAFTKARRAAPDNAKVRTMAAVGGLDGAKRDLALRELASIAGKDDGTRADLALISALITNGDFRAALKAVDALQAKQPTSPVHHQLRGQLLLTQMDFAGARRSFEAAIAQDARHFPAVLALTSMDMATRNADAARAKVRALLAAAPNHSSAMLLLAEIEARSGASPEAVTEQIAAAVRADANDPQARVALIRHLVRIANLPAALAAAQAGAAVMPNDLGLQEALAQMQLLTGNPQQALATFGGLVLRRPTDARLYLQMAEAHIAAKDLAGAARALRRASEIDPDLAEARRGLAMVALRDGRTDEALAIAAEMQKRPAMRVLGHATEGDIEVQRKNWARAAAAYRASLQHGRAGEIAIKLHSTLRAGGQAGEADRFAAEWEKTRPNDPAFRFYLGDLAIGRKDYAAAEGHFRATLVEQPSNAFALNNVAWLMHRQSKPGALALAEKANAALPNRAPLLDTLAMIQSTEGRSEAAIATQQRAIAAAPQDSGLKLALARYLIQAGRREQARKVLDGLAELGDAFGRQSEVSALRNRL